MMTATNWKNVNNWHWVEKNCIPWAKEYFGNHLVGLVAESPEGHSVSVNDLQSFTGDCDLNQRKGKLITIFDVQMKLRWEGVTSDGKKAKGTITIPEFMYDSEIDEIVMDIAVENEEKKQTEVLKKLVKTGLLPLIRKALSTFSTDLIASHQEDVLIPPEKMAGHPAHVLYQPKPPVSDSASNKDNAVNNTSKTVKGAVVTIKQSVEFVCSAADLFNTFLEQSRASIWTRGSAKISKQPGSDFVFFGGNITGQILDIEENKKIIMKWKLKSWPTDHYSKVTMDFEEGSGSVNLHLTQSDVPIGEKEIVESNWHQYFFNPIKATFGYGALL